MSLEYKKESLEWHKHGFECGHENTYGIENRNDMTRINDDEVNNISECNFLHDIIHFPKHNKNLNSHYYPILHVCINTRHSRSKVKNFQTLLDSGCSYMVLMGRLVKKITTWKRCCDTVV